MVASRRDKAIRSWSLNLLDAFVPSEVDSFRFFLLLYGFLYCLQSIAVYII